MYRWTGSRLAAAAALAAVGLALNGSPASAISLFVKTRVPQKITFDMQVELQGIYDEISEIYAPALTDDDINVFYAVVYTPDWVLVYAAGRRLTRAELSARDAQAPEPDAVIWRIEKLSLVPDGVTALITAITVHTFVDARGRYGHPGTTHTLSEITPYRDRWVKGEIGWKMKWREQAGPTKTVLDKPEWGM
jgi:hypothetical protein